MFKKVEAILYDGKVYPTLRDAQIAALEKLIGEFGAKLLDNKDRVLAILNLTESQLTSAPSTCLTHSENNSFFYKKETNFCNKSFSRE